MDESDRILALVLVTVELGRVLAVVVVRVLAAASTRMGEFWK